MEQSIAEAVIDFTEIHVLDVQPLSEWQRWVIKRAFRGDGKQPLRLAPGTSR